MQRLAIIAGAKDVLARLLGLMLLVSGALVQPHSFRYRRSRRGLRDRGFDCRLKKRLLSSDPHFSAEYLVPIFDSLRPEAGRGMTGCLLDNQSHGRRQLHSTAACGNRHCVGAGWRLWATAGRRAISTACRL